MEFSEILTERENKINLIKDYLPFYDCVTLKANIPGNNKQIKEAYLLINIFHNKLKKNYVSFIYIDNADGPMYLYLYQKGRITKDELMKYEDKTLGRFIDFDLFQNESDFIRSINRPTLRKCYLCDLDAFVCIRQKNHSLIELLSFIKKNIEDYLKKLIKKLILSSMMEELDLDPKFGLVTKLTNGSHADMNYEIMKRSQKAIVDDLIMMFFNGYYLNDLKEIFIENRRIGLLTEKKMLKVTNNVNTYKGLIFLLGQTLGALGYNLQNNLDFEEIFNNLKIMCKDLTKELNKGNDTFGKIAYQQYGIEGARGEIERGLPHVTEALSLYDVKKDKLKTLIYFIINADDTVFLKRCHSLNKYLEVKNKFQNLNYNSESINKLSNECIANNYSFGGCADLLIVTIFLKNIKDNLY